MTTTPSSAESSQSHRSAHSNGSARSARSAVSISSNISNASARTARIRAVLSGESSDAPPTKLHVYCQRGQYKKARKLIDEYGAQVNAKRENGMTPLHDATVHGNTECVKVLISRGADVNVRNDGRKSTALHMAAQKGYHDIVQLLLDAGADITIGNITDDTALHETAHFGKVKVAKVLLGNELVTHEFIDTQNASGNTATHFAAMYGRHEVLEQLINAKADLEARNLSEETALHLACYKNHVKCVRLLTKAGVKAESKAGKKGATPMYYAMEFNNLDCAAALIEGGANPDHVSESAKKKLMLSASKNGMPVCVEKLLPFFKDLDISDSKGRTPIHLACEYQHPEVLEIFVKNGMSLAARGPDGATILHDASQKDQYKLVSTLINMGINANDKRYNGNTPMHDAVDKSSMRAVRELLKCGADMNVQNTHDETPVHIAAANGDEEMVRFFRMCRANLKVKNDQGETPLEVAQHAKHDGAVFALSDHKSDESNLAKLLTKG